MPPPVTGVALPGLGQGVSASALTPAPTPIPATPANAGDQALAASDASVGYSNISESIAGVVVVLQRRQSLDPRFLTAFGNQSVDPFENLPRESLQEMNHHGRIEWWLAE